MASVFQEVNRGSRDAAEVFFNLANDQRVAYRTASGHLVTVRQDPDVEDSTGGIVWETAYLLATFLEGRPDNGLPAPQSSVLELGAVFFLFFPGSPSGSNLLEGGLHGIRSLNAERHIDRPELRPHAALACTRNV